MKKRLFSVLLFLVMVSPLLGQESAVSSLWERWLKPYGLGAGILVILGTAIANIGKLRNEDSSGEAWSAIGRMTLYVIAVGALATVLFELVL